MKSRFITLWNQLLESAIRNIGGKLGLWMRRKYYTKRFGSCGRGLRIEDGVIIQGIRNIYLGDNVWIDKYTLINAGKAEISSNNIKKKGNKVFYQNEGELHIGNGVHIAPMCIIQAHAGISIGNYCGIGAGSKIYSLTNLPNGPTEELVHFTPLGNPYYLSAPIVLAENVGLALNCVVMPGVTIEKNSFIGMNSVVIGKISENSYALGHPAKKCKNRYQACKNSHNS